VIDHGARGCEDPACGYLTSCAGSREWMRVLAERKLRAIEDGTIDSCAMPTSEEEMSRLRAAAGRSETDPATTRRGEHRQLLGELAAHIDKSPIGWHDGRPLIHRATSDADLVAWVQRLAHLRDRVAIEVEGLGRTVTDLGALRARRRDIGERLLSKHAADTLEKAVHIARGEDEIDGADAHLALAALARATVKPAECDHCDRELPLPRCPRCGA